MRAAWLTLLLALPGCYEARRLEPDVGPIDAPPVACGTCATIATCRPGAAVTIGCDGTVGRLCSGDPTLTVCDAALVSDPESCSRSSSGFLAFDDDGGEGFCSLVRTTCPRSGRIAIDPEPFSSGSTGWSCPYAVR